MTRHGLFVLLAFAMIVVMLLRLPPIVARQDLVLHTYGALVEVDAVARQRYVEELQGDRLAVGAIRGMLRELDPYSRYYTAEELAAASQRIEGRYVGIGVEIGIVNGQPTIIAPLEGGPAALAGVQPGDLIVEIAGQNVKHLGMIEIEERLHGETGSSVRLALRHPESEALGEFVIERRSIEIETVRGLSRKRNGEWDYLVDRSRGIAYIRLNRFNDTTARSFDKALNAIRAENAQGLILDLRFNPGGTLPGAIAVADRFLNDGVIVSTITRRGVETAYRATASSFDIRLPLAILINGSSASSAEIVAGAIQDHGRALLVGERSFGKGSVQGLVNLKNHDAAVKLTIAHYRLPSGRLIHRGLPAMGPDDWGIQPDVAVILSPDERKLLHRSRYGRDANDNPRETWLDTDRQLFTALESLGEKLKSDSPTLIRK